MYKRCKRKCCAANATARGPNRQQLYRSDVLGLSWPALPASYSRTHAIHDTSMHCLQRDQLAILTKVRAHHYHLFSPSYAA